MEHLNLLEIEIAYQGASSQLSKLQVKQGCTVEEAIQYSGILQQYPEIDLTKNKIGIFSKLVALTTQVKEGDRVEIYQPLLIDPKQARRQRAKGRKS